ncbi:ZinT/AdcA family metal-binding protein [Treponema phagedenis]|uniref:ZinT/AdcA family metal-binding protein n=1 Tax=Treponema phagedenis TaxID=162 RepID=UPI0011E70177|nr:ZinT/AdcA family metal-binding protein [Treponema phagedenis]QEK01357.1 ZinT/AdcA family metal-binding protein [Treponema phagedenis]QEK06378.1 ZinT/AdcA family metal-binding protein [Treponema phagedenis]QEK08948.1 ZinT/AdcA family metal-binding protein [Treponema phagedenis]
MVKKIIGIKRMSFFIFITVFFIACQSAPKSKTETIAAGNEMAAWKGEWVSLDTIKTDAALEDSYTEAAKNMAHYTVEGFKAAVADMYQTPVLKMKFDGTNTVILTVQNNKEAIVEVPCEYVYKGKVAVLGEKNRFWYTFQAAKDIRELKNAKYLIALPPEQDDSGILHWHARISSHDINWLVNGKKTWPTYVAESTPQEKKIQNLKESIRTLPARLPEKPFEQYADNGKWINRPAVFDNTSKEVSAAYEKIIKEFAGKNPKGGDFTKEEIIAEIKKNDKTLNTLDDFTHLSFLTEGKKNELIIYKGEKIVFQSEYKRVAQSTSRPYITMRAEKKDAGKFSLISFVVVHGAPMYHFHLWYGRNETDLENQEGVPTCFSTTKISNETLANYIEKTCRRTLTAEN